MINLQDPAERAAAAGEYVLGTLSPEDHALVGAMLEQDSALKTGVYHWQDRLLSLTASIPAAAPSPALWQRIEVAVAATVTRPRAYQPPARLPWWQRVQLWQGVSALAVAASILLASLLLLRTPTPDIPSVRYLAVLQSPDKHATGWVVEIKAGQTLRLVPVADTGAMPAGRSLQFWTKPQGAAGPTSLGLVRAGQTVEFPVSRLPAVGTEQLFEITLEPENGSPIGRPTGPILYVGRTVAI
ncbi:anti-sigma factor [Chitinimonas naiadis]